jgi:hypothetical protein
MAWIKRNLLLALGGLMAVALLGFGIFYFWTNRQKNKEIEGKLEENKSALTRLINQDPYPSRTNITRAKEELVRVEAAVQEAKMFFQPVPFEAVTGQAFKSLLDQTLYDLHQKAVDASVELPNKDYAFTFAHQKTQLQFPPEAFPALPQQLAEIKRICEVLFDARINKLITLRRSRLYAEEPVSQVDHHEMTPVVNEAMGMASNPYIVVFHGFTPELATAMQAFYQSTNGLVVRSVAAEPAPTEVANVPGGQAGAPVNPVVRPAPTQPAQPGATRPGVPAAAKPEGIKTVLNERLLKITLVIEVLRTAPKKV